MEQNDQKKTAELAEEDMDQVTGGGFLDGFSLGGGLFGKKKDKDPAKAMDGKKISGGPVSGIGGSAC